MLEGYITSKFISIISALIVIYLAYLWSKGSFKKEEKQIKNISKQFGIFTALLFLFWIVLLPTGVPDDFITFWIISKVGVLPFTIGFAALTIYLIWRIRLTIVIYKK